MDNASKALLIAGAVLLVIAIIAVAMGIFGTARGVVDDAEGQIDNMSVQMHNKQFLEYEKNGVTFQRVKECISQMCANNTNATESKYKVGLKVSYYTNSAHTSKNLHCSYTGAQNVNGLITGCAYLNSITYQRKLYDIILEYANNGIVNNINVISYGSY